MATSFAGNMGGRKIFLQVSVDCTGDMRLKIISLPTLAVSQGRAAVYDYPRWVVQVGSQIKG
jgi:hypothetical protein